MKKIYGLIVEDTLELLIKDKKKNLDELFSFCTLDEVEEVINKCKSDDSIDTSKIEKWLKRKRDEMTEFINYISSSNYSEYYLDNNYSIDFLNSLRRFLGLEVRFYRDKTNDFRQVEFFLNDNELRIDSIISSSIKRQRDKNSRLRGYKDSDEERVYQLFYREVCLKEEVKDKTKEINKELNEEQEMRKKIEKSLRNINKVELNKIIRRDRDFDYSETKEQLLRLIESYGYTEDIIYEIDFMMMNRVKAILNEN